MPIFAEILGVEVFSVGQHKGKNYTEADLDAMVDNFRKFSTGDKRLVQVPGVIGHEETQPLMDNTGIPKVCRMDTLEKKTVPCEWCQGSGIFKAAEDNITCPGCKGAGKRTVLLSDLGEAHPKIADLIRNKNYDRCSLEVYDEPPEGVPGKGKMARRLALLGGQLPQIKDLSALPTTFAESKPREVRMKFGKVINRGNGIFQVFSELVPVEKFGGPGSGPQSGESLSGMHKDTFDSLKPAMEKQVGREVAPHKKAIAAGGVIHGEAPEVQKALVEHLKSFDPEAHSKLQEKHHISLEHAFPRKFDENLKGTAMDRQSMLAKLDEMGVDISTFTPENITDEALKALLDTFSAPVANAEDPNNALLNPSTGDDMAKKMAERRRRFAETCKKYAEPAVIPLPLEKKPDAANTEEGGDVSGKNIKGQMAALGMGTENRSKYDSANHAEFSEAVEKRLTQIETRLMAKLVPAVKAVDDFTEETERSTVQTFCENMHTAGKLDASDLDNTNPKVRSQVDRLMSLDNKSAVTKFSEKGKTITLTARQEAMEEIRQRRPRQRGEKLKASVNGVSKFSETVINAEVNEVENHWESFAEDFNRVDTSKDEYVNAFKNERKVNHKLTAEEYNARTKLQTV